MLNLNERTIKEKDFLKCKEAKDKIKFLLRYAVLAPSTHNSQPWLFKITNNSCSIFQNPDIKLPQADAKGRDMYISFGCLIENLIIAAKHFGVFDKVFILPKGEANLIAKITFKNLEKKNSFNSKYSSLLKAILKRVTVRGLFDKRSIPNNILSKLKRIEKSPNLTLFIKSDKETVKKIAELTAQGLKIAYKSHIFRDEMSKWVNNNFSNRREGIPGYALRMNNFLSVIFPTLVKYRDIGAMVSVLNYKSMVSTPCVCVITANKDSKINWIETGRLAQRSILYLYSKNVKSSIFVASVEMGDLYKQVQSILKTSQVPQFVFCSGYMSFEQKPTPRHPIEEKLLN